MAATRIAPVVPSAARTRPPSRTSRPSAGAPPTRTAADAPRAARPQRGGIRIRKGRLAAVVACLVLVALIAWPIGLLAWANGKITHEEALSGAPDTSGTTYLIAGSDARGEGISEDGTSGARTDTIMVLHSPPSGPVALISIPRDSYAEIPGKGGNKLNAAYSWGGAPLLVKTVEKMSGLTVDHYVEVGFGGVEKIVDSLGGVRLCYDADVEDKRSELSWKAGCHMADGHTALAFSRMRYSDPKGDIGRAERQRQVIGAISSTAANPSIAFRPADQVSLLGSGLGALTVDQKTGIVDLGRLAMAFKAANGPDGITGTPPIATMNYRPGGIGSAVLLDPDQSPTFWADIRDGKLPAGTVGGVPG